MKDLRIVQPFTVLQFSEMTQEDNFFRFSGPADYSTVVKVIVNDNVIEELALFGKDLLAYIPEGMDTDEIRYAALISEETRTSSETMLRLGVGPIPTEIEGQDRLVQLFAKVLLQTAGSDIYYPAIGGGLLAVKNRGAVDGDLNVSAAEISNSLKKTEQDVKFLQTGLRLPAEETLVSATVLNVSAERSTGDINAFVRLQTLAGTNAYFNVAA